MNRDGVDEINPQPEPQQFAPPPPPGGAAAAGSPTPPPAAPAQAPGWYPAPGGQRYWDGEQWTEHTAPSTVGGAPASVTMTHAEEKQMAMFAHLGQLLGLLAGIGGFVAPLIIMLTKGKESAFVRQAAVESLNFWITGILAAIVSFALILVLVGFILVPLVALVWIIFPIIAGVKANEGVDYRYPFNIRLIS